MSFLKNLFHHQSNYDQSPPVHMIYPAREAYQMPIDYTGTGSSQWNMQQQPQQGYQLGMQQGGMMQQPQHMQQQQFGGPPVQLGFQQGQQQQQQGGMMMGQQGQIGQGGQPMGQQPPMMMGQQGQMGGGAFPMGQQPPMMMGGGAQPNFHQHPHQQHGNFQGGLPGNQGGPMGNMGGERERMIIPGQHGVLVIEGPQGGFQQMQQGGMQQPHHQMGGGRPF